MGTNIKGVMNLALLQLGGRASISKCVFFDRLILFTLLNPSINPGKAVILYALSIQVAAIWSRVGELHHMPIYLNFIESQIRRITSIHHE